MVGALVAVAANTALFSLIFTWLTADGIPWRDTLPGAVVAAVGWQTLQLVGSALVAHKLKGAQSTYGTFAAVIGLLSWFYLQAQITLYAAEIDVARQQRLWPRGLRSLTNTPTTRADRQAYEAYATRERYAADAQEDVDVRFPGQEPSRRRGPHRGSGDGRGPAQAAGGGTARTRGSSPGAAIRTLVLPTSRSAASGCSAWAQVARERLRVHGAGRRCKPRDGARRPCDRVDYPLTIGSGGRA